MEGKDAGVAVGKDRCTDLDGFTAFDCEGSGAAGLAMGLGLGSFHPWVSR